MPVLLVTYDLNKEIKRPPIVKKIKTLGSSRKRLSESSYAIKTTKTPTSIKESLQKFIDDDDDLYVITLRDPWDGFGRPDVINWLDTELD